MGWGRTLACVGAVASALAWSGAPRADPAAPTLDAQLAKPALVDIGGRRLNVFCLGEGSPTIVFGQGGEGNIANWKKVQPAVSALTRTCFYDRAGFGYSDPTSDPITGLQVTDELHALLRAAKIKGPVVLVGHSVGGFYATLYADRFADEVAGLVLVDPGFDGQGDWRTDDDRKVDNPHNLSGEANLLKCAALARAGKLSAANLASEGCYPPPPQDAAPGEAAYVLHAITRPSWYEAEYSQSVNYFPRDAEVSVSHGQERAAYRSFGDLPLVVLSAAGSTQVPWRSEDANRRSNDHWLAGHRALAKRSSRGRWALVPGANHFIQLSQPQAVIDAIQAVVDEVRAKRPPTR